MRDPVTTMSRFMRIHRALHDLQARLGYLPATELAALSTQLEVSLHRVHELASGYPHYRLEPPPAVEVKVCRDLACELRGASECRRALETLAASLGGRQVVVGGASCLGRCDTAPAVVVNDSVVSGRHASEYVTLVEQVFRTSTLPVEDEPDVSDVGWALDPYRGRPLYSAVSKYLTEGGPGALLDALKVAFLRGMGGAGQPAHIKWRDTFEAEGDEKFVVCNADESEPATFKDREILQRAPHLVIEGMVLAGLLLGARTGLVYVRHEYRAAIRIVRAAIERAYETGVCGANIVGSGRTFDLEVLVSPGGYICGEQGALIEAIEDRRAEPRNRPPELQTNGLFDQPTLLSNVETFAWVPAIVLNGSEWYAGLGVNGAKGARLFSVCGDVARPGVYEMPIGAPLGELIERAGGVRGGLPLKAVACSGPSGGFTPAILPPGDLDLRSVPLDIDAFRGLGLMLGAGLVVYAEGADLVAQALSASRFFRNESCGKCVPCRIGSQKLAETAERLATRRHGRAELEAANALVRDLEATLGLTSICGLGMSAGKPLATLLQSFPRDLGLDAPLSTSAPEAAP